MQPDVARGEYPCTQNGMLNAPGIQRRSRARGLTGTTGRRTRDTQIRIIEGGVRETKAELEAWLNTRLSTVYQNGLCSLGSRVVAYLVKVPIVDEQALVVRDGHDARARGDDLCRVVVDGLANREWQLAATASVNTGFLRAVGQPVTYPGL